MFLNHISTMLFVLFLNMDAKVMACFVCCLHTDSMCCFFRTCTMVIPCFWPFFQTVFCFVFVLLCCVFFRYQNVTDFLGYAQCYSLSYVNNTIIIMI